MKKFVLFLILSITIPLFGADEQASQAAEQAMSSEKAQQQVVGQLAFSELGGDYYFLFNLAYEFNLGLFGIGVQLPLNILVSCETEGGCDDKTWNRIRKADWDDFSDYLKVIRYVRYGHKFDEKNLFYGRFGSLSNAYIGHGTIVNNYLNTIDWTDFKPGLQFDVYTNYGGVETITNDISDPTLIGLRGFVRPLSFVFSPDSIFSRFAVGLSYIADIDSPTTETDPDTGAIEEGSEVFSIIGFDMEIRVFKNRFLTITPYMDFNKIIDYGEGFHLGVNFLFHIPLTGAYFRLKPEYRYFWDEYIPTYFDAQYELSRTIKKYGIEGQKAKHGYYIELGYDQYLLETPLFNVKGIYEDYEGDNNSSLLLYAAVPLLDDYKFSAVYSKSGFDTLSEAFDLDGALFIAEASLKLYTPVYLRAQYRRSWYSVVDENTGDTELEDESEWTFGFYVAFQF